MYQLKSVVRRAVLFIPVLGMLGASMYQMVAPAVSSADALNPLTKRSLLLTSSSPGWAYTDGSGDSTYAPAGSGPNGKETGETFTFDTSSDSSSTPIKAFSLQYCTAAAGNCYSPGNDMEEDGTDPGSDCTEGATTPTTGDLVCAAGSAPYYSDDATHTDFNIVSGNDSGTSYPISSPGTGWPQGGTVNSNVPTTTDGDFQVYYNTNTTGIGAPVWVASTATWTMTDANVEDAGDPPTSIPTGANNYIQLTSSTGQDLSAGQEVEIQFQPSDSNYITNPGADAFFVKINDYETTADPNYADNDPYNDICGGGSSDCPANVTDGGVTVAQVMNQSIEIQTKVLETMDFSVGTVDPDTVPAADLSGSQHGSCDAILPQPPSGVTQNPANPSANTLLLGNPDEEYSLSTNTAYDTNSLFRVSTNAANGATVYYSGETLSDTEGNQIQPIGDTAEEPDPGTEQFGLALESNLLTDDSSFPYANPVNVGSGIADNYQVPYESGLDSGFTSDVSTHSYPYWYDPTLSPMVPTTGYGGGYGTAGALDTASFAFDANANTVPVPIATEDTQVVDCSTGYVRYVADIAPSTPAGIYTTAINYLAAPEY